MTHGELRRGHRRQAARSAPSASACTPPTSRRRSAARAARRSSRCSSRSRPAGSPTRSAGSWALPRPGGSTWPTTSSASAGCCRPCAARCPSATRSPRRTPAPTSPRSRPPRAATATTYVLNGEKWHVTSYNDAAYVFFQGVLDRRARTPASTRCSSSTSPAPGCRVVRTPEYSHTISHHHPIVAFEDVRVPGQHLVGGEGDGMTFSYEWFRFERLMIAARCLGAAERLIEEATAFAQAAHRRRRAADRAPARPGHAGRQPHRAVRRPVDGLRDGTVDRRAATTARCCTRAAR